MSSVLSSSGSSNSEDPPPWEIPGVVGAERVITRSPDVVVTVGGIQVFSTGFSMTFYTRFRPSAPDPDDAELHRLLRRDRSPDPDRLVMGVRFADGWIAANVDTAAAETGPWLDRRAAGGSNTIWRVSYWASRVPIGDTVFFAAWPARDVSSGEAVFRADELRARKAIQQLG